jgi:hypothetical protein
MVRRLHEHECTKYFWISFPSELALPDGRFQVPDVKAGLSLDALERTVQATLYSACVKDERPLSLLIVAKPESGKTLVLKKYRENKGIVYLTDCTA